MNRNYARAIAVVFVLALYAAPGVPAAAATTTTGFTVASTIWGTATSPAEAAPGTQNVPLTIVLQYNYYNTAQGISATLTLPPGFTDTNGNAVTTAYYVSPVPSGTAISLTFNLDIGPNVQLGTYTFPMTIAWGAIVSAYPLQSVSETQSTYASIALRGKVQLQFSSGQAALTAGTLNHLPILVNNTGTGNATDVLLSISTATNLLSLVMSSSTITVLSSPPEIQSISAGSSVVTYVGVFVPQAVAGSSTIISITGTYSDAYGNTREIAASVGIYVNSISSAPITVGASSLVLVAGVINNSTIMISNVGQQPLTQVQVTVAAPPTVSLLRQFPVTIASLVPGSSTQISMPLFVSAALSGTPVTVSVGVTYTEAGGETGSTTQSLGFYVPISTNPRIQLASYSYNPPAVYPGMTVATLQVLILNSGTTSATNVNATLVPVNPVYSTSAGSFMKSSGLLPAGQAFPFTFILGIRNSSTPINVTLGLQVSSPGVAPMKFSIPFTENPKAVMHVDSVDAPSIVVGDGADSVSVVLENAGLAAAQYTTITMLPSNVFQPSIPSSESPLLALTAINASVGTILPGEQADFTYVVQVSSNIQAGVYPITFLATWRQPGSTEPFAQQLRLNLQVAPTVYQVAASHLMNPVVLLLIVLLVAALAVTLIRRRRARKQ